MVDATEPIQRGDCHYCGEPVGDVFAGMLGRDVIRVRRHLTATILSHPPLLDAEVWITYVETGDDDE